MPSQGEQISKKRENSFLGGSMTGDPGKFFSGGVGDRGPRKNSFPGGSVTFSIDDWGPRKILFRGGRSPGTQENSFPGGSVKMLLFDCRTIFCF